MKTVCVTYVGRRLTTKNKLAHFWLASGEQAPRGYLKQFAPARIGEQWNVTFDDDGRLFIAGEHKPVQCAGVTRKYDPAWITADQVAYQHDLDRKADAKLKARRSDFDDAIEPLRNLVLAVNSWSERQALVARISSELLKPQR